MLSGTGCLSSAGAVAAGTTVPLSGRRPHVAGARCGSVCQHGQRDSRRGTAQHTRMGSSRHCTQCAAAPAEVTTAVDCAEVDTRRGCMLAHRPSSDDSGRSACLLGRAMSPTCMGEILQQKPHTSDRHVIRNLRPLATQAAIPAGPSDEPPSYTEIDSKPYNRLFMHLFRRSVVSALGEDAPEPGFDGIITLTRRLSTKFDDPRDSQQLVRGILKALFPQWLLPAFRVMFAEPLPAFSYWLNALVTALACEWLMGRCQVNAVELEDGKSIQGRGVKVERCRVLEQSGCASVCVNCCKIPTQEFFKKDMGIDVRLTPNYEDFSCQFDFGRQPLPPEQDEALNSPCFTQCPSKMAHSVKPKCGGLDFTDERQL